jgi:hypothetical protein
MFTRLANVGFNGGRRAPELSFELLLEVILPMVGIVLELVNWKFARWVNIGSFTVAGCFWLAEAIWWRSDAFFGVLANCCVRTTDNRWANRRCLRKNEK